MSVSVLGDEHDAAVDRPHARVFDFTGWPAKGWVMVGADRSESDEELSEWVNRRSRFALSLPAK